ncbi:RNA polymerase subunit sigma-24 [Phycicoccus sp. Root563]|nr:RNA polymerase subunit sigma-24 [Phycicoccus sp. Root101]KQZ90873.1 RNA polymerase subunit sigma-24 [Phycicoccus sp. Root563]
MTAVRRDEHRPDRPSPGSDRISATPMTERGEPADWVEALSTPGPGQVQALHLLHQLMVRAAAHQVWRMRAVLPNSSPGAVEVIANQAADEAMTALLAKVHTFEGRSRFTTWAYKFAILQAATDVRRVQWQHREVELHDLELSDPPTVGHDSPEHQAEASDLARAVARAMRTALTPHQRRVALALLVDDIPIDVLADRLGTSRGALYKTVHDVRVRLRTELASRGYLLDATATVAPKDQPILSNPAGTP